MTIFVFLGPPGVGKGTQAKKLSADLHYGHWATGDLLREALKNQTELGLKAKSYMERGALVPDDVVIDMVREKMDRLAGETGLILDGFPRTAEQAMEFQRLLKEGGRTLTRVVFFELPEAELVTRMVHRRVCRQCGANFHLLYVPPKTAQVCDLCGGELYQRSDDQEATVKQRLEVYRNQTAELISFYRRKNLLCSFPAEGSPGEVYQRLRGILVS